MATPIEKLETKLATTQKSGLPPVVVNERLAIARCERKRLEAVLYNCVRSGTHVQNRKPHPGFRAHLRGKIANVRAVDPRHAGKLEKLFARIVWGLD